jgi:hypothetical protein
LWTDEGYEKIEWNNYAYKECREEEAKFKGLKGEPLRRTHDWDRQTPTSYILLIYQPTKSS